MTTIARHHHIENRGDDTGTRPEVVLGVDTHRDTHTAAVLTTHGQLLGHHEFPTDTAGYLALHTWASTFGALRTAGVEGTGTYGTALATFLSQQDIEVLEIDRPDRRARRRTGKSDPLDAEAAARAVLARSRIVIAKDHRGHVEALRNLRVARRSAVEQRADCTRRIKALIITAPEDLRSQLRDLDGQRLIRTCAALHPDTTRVAEPTQAAQMALRSLARTHQNLSTEIDDLEDLIGPLVEATNPALTRLNGIGTDTAAQMLITAGENTNRIRSEAAFAMLCGAAPIPASSGQTHRHRLNRGGDRQANAALYRVVLSRLRWDPATQAYAQRRTEQGLSKKDIIRCLKRYVAREIYTALKTTPPTPTDATTAA